MESPSSASETMRRALPQLVLSDRKFACTPCSGVCFQSPSQEASDTDGLPSVRLTGWKRRLFDARMESDLPPRAATTEEENVMIEKILKYNWEFYVKD